MGWEKYDKEAEAERGYGRMSLYISLDTIKKVDHLRRILRDQNGDVLSKSLVIDEAIKSYYDLITTKKEKK